jgi:FkbM family methyltransferase
MEATWDGFTYLVEDETFQWHINRGLSEPYPRELMIVKTYLAQYPARNNLFIDVGGHVGTTSLPYSRLFKNVIAFEPNPVSYDLFKQSISRNNITNIEVHNKGVYHKTTDCKIVKHGSNSGCYFIQECEKSADSIPVVRLDDLPIDQPVDFIKIDTEGSEYFVLQGASELISKYKPLINIETNTCSSQYFGYDKERIFEFLRALNYTVLDDDGNNPLFYCNE